ncbi:Spermatid-specific manchette-related protein 1 [Amazona aestiva]|uniref:Spermatid-specific manchette-related protein 1 n=1 Tax=Amazona aestiva TaxID=12930 RepID=A0A0Q3P0H7_AMAAE|nr:Spermatid-specific manchette-related protein 1 [Amazona aestiva]
MTPVPTIVKGVMVTGSPLLQGLTMPPEPSPTIQAPPDLRAAMREYYKSTMYKSTTVYSPGSFTSKEKVVVADMVHRVPVYTVTGRIPFQSYYVPCSGRHCCLRGIDYYLGGTPATRKKLSAVEERADHSVPPSKAQSDVLCLCSLPPAVLAVQDA